ncbi:MAG: PQQ-dependent sugar dehydrogenase [Desulfobacterales bacterium]
MTGAKPGSQHFGSHLIWMPDGTLLVSIGAGGNPPVRLAGAWIRNQAQNRRSHLGKILRLNADGTVPRDNPFSNSAHSSTGRNKDGENCGSRSQGRAAKRDRLRSTGCKNRFRGCPLRVGSQRD